MLPTTGVESRSERHVFLLGRPPLEEFLGFVTTFSEEKGEVGTLANEWRSANDHVKTLETGEASVADNPVVAELSPNLRAMADRVLSDPVCQRTFEVLPVSIGIVELDRLVVFQKQINLAYVDSLKNGLGPKPSAEDVFSFCLPTDPALPPVKMLRVAQNSYAFVSSSNDLRFLEPVVFDPSQVMDYRASGRVAAIIGLVVGYGSNYLTALHVEGRLILNNGSHRAYTLRELGVTHVPCLIQEVSRREELGVVATPEIIQNPDRYLTEPRPPLLKDYFDSRLRKVIPIPRKIRQVRVSFGIELSEMPG